MSELRERVAAVGRSHFQDYEYGVRRCICGQEIAAGEDFDLHRADASIAALREFVGERFDAMVETGADAGAALFHQRPSPTQRNETRVILDAALGAVGLVETGDEQ